MPNKEIVLFGLMGNFRFCSASELPLREPVESKNLRCGSLFSELLQI